MRKHQSALMVLTCLYSASSYSTEEGTRQAPTEAKYAAVMELYQRWLAEREEFGTFVPDFHIDRTNMFIRSQEDLNEVNKIDFGRAAQFQNVEEREEELSDTRPNAN